MKNQISSCNVQKGIDMNYIINSFSDDREIFQTLYYSNITFWGEQNKLYIWHRQI